MFLIKPFLKQKSLVSFSLIAVILLSGCAKFLKSESENLTPFADQTISLVSSLEYGLSDNEILYLRRIHDYIDDEAPFDRFNALENQASNQLKALVVYSIQMVTISERPISENEKSNELADILISLSDMVNRDKIVIRGNKDKKSLSANELANLHNFMTKRMAVMNENYNQMKPDIDAYYESHRELKKMVETKETGIKEARLTFIVWSRAYQKMALGKTNPAEWFDVSESGNLLMGAAGRAAGL